MSATSEPRVAVEREGIAPASATIPGEPAVSRATRTICDSLALIGIVALAIRRWTLVGPFPPGLDGAQWLAIGRGLTGSTIGRSTEGAYAPLVPLLAAAAESIDGPLPGVRLLAAASGLAVSLAIWYVARAALGPLWGLAVAAIVIPASALAEPVLFGGYPQQFALAAGLIALWAVCRYLTHWSSDADDPILTVPTGGIPARVSPLTIGRGTGDSLPLMVRTTNHRRASLVPVAIAALVAAAAHHIYFPVFVLAMLTAVALRLARGPRPRDGLRLVAPLALALSPALALFAVIALAFVRAGYAAPLDASARSLAAAWEYGAREAPAVWLLLLSTGAAALVLRRLCDDPAWLFAVSLLLPAGLLFLLTGQPRLLPLILVAAGVAAGLGARWGASLAPRAEPGALLLAFAIAAMLFHPADRATARFADFYRVVDASLLQAAAVIETDGGSGAVAVRKDRRGWPIGWWFEALLARPVIVGSDPRWLAFPAEREHALQAAALFDGGLDAATFRRRAAAAGVRYLVVAKWDWIGWERWLARPGFPVATLYDDDRYLVLRVT